MIEKVTQHHFGNKVISCSIYMALLLLLFTACLPSDPNNPCPPDCDPISEEDSIEYIWHTPLSATSATGISNLTPVLYKENVLFDLTEADPDLFWSNPVIVILDKQTGVKNLELKPNGYTAIAYDYVLLDDNLIVRYFRNDKFLVCWDLNSAEENWSFQEDDQTNPYKMQRQIASIDESLFLVEGNKWNDSIQIMQMDIATGSVEAIIDLVEMDLNVKEKNLSDVACEENEQGDILLYFAVDYTLNTESGEAHLEKLLAFNFTEGNIEWQQIATDLHPLQATAPVVYEDLVILCGGDKWVRAFRKSDGSIKWERQINKISQGGISISSPLLVDDRLYIKTNSRELYCLNTFDGGVVWEGEDHGEKDRTVSRFFVLLVEDPFCPSLTSPIDRKLYWPHSLAAGAKSDEDPNLPNFARPMVCERRR